MSNAAREKLARWMIKEGFATGHGDTFEDLLQELSWRVKDVEGRIEKLLKDKRPGHGNGEAKK